jgi:NDP-sugar pyrophosphorylase family protein
MTTAIPKTLLPVAGRPFAEHQLEWLAREGIQRVVYCIGHLGEQVREVVGDGQRFGLDVRYSDEGATRLGTAGAIRLALYNGLLNEAFFVLYGDSYLEVDLATVGRTFRRAETDALMVVYRNRNEGDRSNAVVRGRLVVAYDKWIQSPQMEWIDYGLSIFAARLIADLVAPGQVADLADLCHSLSHSGQLSCFEAALRFHEIGSPAGLARLETRLSSTS